MQNFTKFILVSLLAVGLFMSHAAEDPNQKLDAITGLSQAETVAGVGSLNPSSNLVEYKNTQQLVFQHPAVSVGFDPDPVEVFNRPYPNKIEQLDEGMNEGKFEFYLRDVIPYEIYEHLSRDKLEEVTLAFKKSTATQYPSMTPEEINERVIKYFGEIDKKPPTTDQATSEEARECAYITAQDILDDLGIYSLSEQGELEHKPISLQEKANILNKIFSKYFCISYPESILESTLTKDITHYLLEDFFSWPNRAKKNMLIDNVYQAAKRILQKTRQGDKLVAFGNTPYLIYTALLGLITNDPSDKNYRELISFPFSGSPNKIRPNDDGTTDTHKNTVTPKRLAHLKERMRKAGLINNQKMLTHTTYFIDLFSTGGGPAYVIDEMISAFKEQGSESVPKIAIISINEIHPGHYRIAKAFANDGEKTRLYFPSIDETCFAIDAFVVFVGGYEKLDKMPIPFRMLPTYNPAFWDSSYDWLLDQELTNPQKMLLSYFNNCIRNHAARDEINRLLSSYPG